MSARTPAPGLPDSLTWVNARDVPRLWALRGRVVLLHFFAYGNINSQHVLPDLRYLENKYHDGVTILGIHTPKFTQERQPTALLKAVNRLHLRHAVASDPDFLCWQLYGVKSWPTVAVIDTEGGLVGLFPGEGRRAELDVVVGDLLDQAAARDGRVYESLAPVARPEPKMPLRFPGHLLATETTLYVSDSGNNRVLETSHDGRILRQFGSGNPGFWDGKGADAGFSNPQGLALAKESLFVADLGNHAVRRISLLGGDVETVAGTGTQGMAVVSDAPEPKTIGLNAPIDLVASGERLYVALAGSHQIWMYDLMRQRIGAYAGTGRPGIGDGAASGATFAQPSALATHGQMLYVADADSSAVRAIRFLDGTVKTLLGAGLYDFGDTDGQPQVARLQHPMALAVDPGGSILWVADTFNNKIKALSTRGGGVCTLGLPYRFHEPTGISVAARALWVANTNAHEVVRIDTGTGQVQRVPIGE